MPSLTELMTALPAVEVSREEQQHEALPLPLEAWSLRPVPLGRLRRLRMLGTLQAKIAAAYLFYWLRGWFKDADENKRLLAETNWQNAFRLLDTMSYLRGATMKVGQTLAGFPDIVPREFCDTLDQLHFDAPPMHWSLLSEMVRNELEDEPDNVFSQFEHRAFAAASLGQVHRARLTNGEDVAVKIQYPGIARTIRQDLRNLLLVLLPARLSRDWENTKDQFEDLFSRLEREADYEREAAMLERARPLFTEDDGIVVPKVYRRLSTGRLLTMERLGGVHLDQFLASNPSQETRNEFARKLVRAWYRMMFAGRLLHADIHPGNFLFMDDGRLGVIDFGFVVELDDTLWELFRRMDRALTTGRRDDRLAALQDWCWVSDDPADQDRLRVVEEFAEWTWRARYYGGPFDFGDTANFRRGVDLFTEMVRKRYSRARACTPVMARHNFGWLSMLYRLRAKIDIAPIAEEEVRATGWDRHDYAPLR
jgi:predicted unusual protein kinase regulating ubiquinone biosynthesis (AarF/ABC1/UbiB family)